MSKLVRIHPPNSSRGYHAKTYLLSGSGYPKFSHMRGWYEVDDATAEKLSRVLNNPFDSHSKPVFQVVSKVEAEAMEVAEKEQVAEAASPIPIPKAKVEEVLEDDLPDEAWGKDLAKEVPEVDGVETEDLPDLTTADLGRSKPASPRPRKKASKKAKSKG